MSSSPLRPAVRHGAPSVVRRLLRRQAGTSALLHFRCKVEHGLLRDDAPLATGKGSVRLIDSGKNFRAGTFTLFPQGKSFLYRIFLALQAAALYSVADKRLLVRGEFHFHRLSVSESIARSNTGATARPMPHNRQTHRLPRRRPLPRTERLSFHRHRRIRRTSHSEPRRRNPR